MMLQQGVAKRAIPDEGNRIEEAPGRPPVALRPECRPVIAKIPGRFSRIGCGMTVQYAASEEREAPLPGRGRPAPMPPRLERARQTIPVWQAWRPNGDAAALITGDGHRAATIAEMFAGLVTAKSR